MSIFGSSYYERIEDKSNTIDTYLDDELDKNDSRIIKKIGEDEEIVIEQSVHTIQQLANLELSGVVPVNEINEMIKISKNGKYIPATGKYFDYKKGDILLLQKTQNVHKLKNGEYFKLYPPIINGLPFQKNKTRYLEYRVPYGVMSTHKEFNKVYDFENQYSVYTKNAKQTPCFSFSAMLNDPTVVNGPYDAYAGETGHLYPCFAPDSEEELSKIKSPIYFDIIPKRIFIQKYSEELSKEFEKLNNKEDKEKINMEEILPLTKLLDFFNENEEKRKEKLKENILDIITLCGEVFNNFNDSEVCTYIENAKANTTTRVLFKNY